jgi:energy-coupling factor transporter ATP-binding protein EcfA2
LPQEIIKMTNPIEQHQARLEQVLQLLRKGGLFSLSSEKRETLETEAAGLVRKLDHMEARYLTIGLVGGTGVGKSTLMNALAGAPIASTSHRRPHTDRVLIYRHESAQAPSISDTENIPRQEILHQGDRIRRILLCDLPDFDSLVGEHRERVIRFMVQLDLVLWVTSPEKYADHKFYGFLSQAPKARENFTFVLNKADLLFNGETLEKGYGQLNRVMTRFGELLQENGIAEPILFALASEEAFKGESISPWNQFPAFRQHVFRERNAKQITAIKAMNLDVEIQALIAVFEREIHNLKSADRILENALKDLEAQRSLWVQTGKEIIDRWFGKQVQEKISLYQGEPSRLAGPGYAFAMVFLSLGKGSEGRSEKQTDFSIFQPPDQISDAFRKRMTWVEDRLSHGFLNANLPSSLQSRLEETLCLSRRFENLGERFFQTATAYAAEKRRSPLWGFRFSQWVVYGFILAAFLLSLGGQNAWRHVFLTPSGESLLNLLLAVIGTLFSATGLAALGSFAIINLCVGWAFYRRYRTILLGNTRKHIGRLKEALSHAWESNLTEIISDLTAFREDMGKRRENLLKLQNKEIPENSQ